MPAGTVASSIVTNPPRVRQLAEGVWGFTRRSPVGGVSATVLVVLIVVAVLAPWLAPHHPNEFLKGKRLLPPGREFPMGTDSLGRDVLSRVIYGSRVSLLVGFLSVAIGTAMAVVVGLTSGYWSGKLDLVLQRVVDTLMAFPPVVLALALVAFLSPSLHNVILVIGILVFSQAARVVRGMVLSVKENAYVEAARALGAGHPRILLRHILPNIVAPIIVVSSVFLGHAIIIEAAMSFLGMGTPPDIPSWGGMLSREGRRNLEMGPWLALFPGIAISVTVLAFNLFGDALRDTLDPRLRQG